MRIFEHVSGQRMMASYFRIGGLALEPPLDFFDRVQALLKILPAQIDEYKTCSPAIPSGSAASRALAI